MITFRCRCSHQFSVPDDQAGESLQCPSCGLLVDVPTLEELPSLQEDGSYVLQDAVPPSDDDLPDLKDTPHILARGDTKDRRLSLNEFLKIGTTDEDLLEIKDEVRPGIPKHPKYDPVTGELIVPMEVKRAPVVAQPVMAQPVVLGYEVSKHKAEPTIWMPVWGMFELPNMVVCLIVSILHFTTVAMAMVAGRIWFLALLVLPMFLMTISHFANVVDETGPTANDEMPRPMRGANLYDDFIRPLVQVFFAYALAYAPVLLFNLYVSKLSSAANLTLLVLFFVLVPALLLTLITSGAVNNLVPTRAFSVIGVSSWHYWVVVVMGFIATIAFGVGTAFATSSGDALLHLLFIGPPSARQTVFLPHTLEMIVSPIAVFISVYLVHVFCWQMGLLYRLHHERFSWVLQKHDKSARNDVNAQLQNHRQRELEERARRARENLGKNIPVARPVNRKP